MSKHQQLQRREPIVDMSELARTIDDPVDYAPPAVRNLQATETNQITRGLEQILAEMREVRSAAKAECETLDTETDETEAVIVKQIERKIAEWKRLHAGVRLSIDTMRQLREQCTKLDEPDK